MDPQDNGDNPPDSWEQQADGGSGDQDGMMEAAKTFAGLNVNAPPFIPGQNPYAPAFVPSIPAKISPGK